MDPESIIQRRDGVLKVFVLCFSEDLNFVPTGRGSMDSFDSNNLGTDNSVTFFASGWVEIEANLVCRS
jgi:hypothetical protein